MDDAEIVGLYWARDESALEATRTKYGGFARSLAVNLLGSAEDAEECAQDAYLALWRSIPPERPESLKAYLGRIVRNTAADIWNRAHAKKRDAGLTVLLSELEDCLPSPSDPQAELESRELGRAVSAWLRTLDADSRALFLRRYWYGQELKTLAREWGVSANALAQRTRRLRISLRAALEKEGFII